MQQWFRKLTTLQKTLLGLAAFVAIPLLVLPALAILVMGFSAFSSDVGCRNYTVQPNKTLEAQASELQSVALLAGNEGSWQQGYTGKNCGNSAQKFYAERTVTVSGTAAETLRELRSQLASQNYYPNDEKYTGLSQSTCEGKYFATLPLKDGGSAVITLNGTLPSAACSQQGWLTESDFSDTSVTKLQVFLST